MLEDLKALMASAIAQAIIARHLDAEAATAAADEIERLAALFAEAHEKPQAATLLLYAHALRGTDLAKLVRH